MIRALKLVVLAMLRTNEVTSVIFQSTSDLSHTTTVCAAKHDVRSLPASVITHRLRVGALTGLDLSSAIQHPVSLTPAIASAEWQRT